MTFNDFVRDVRHAVRQLTEGRATASDFPGSETVTLKRLFDSGSSAREVAEDIISAAVGAGIWS
jgi:hypothetical protein